MAGQFPNIPGTGDNVPVSSYTVGITEAYPNVNRQRIVESSINSKEKVDVLPVNMGVNYRLSDKYLEFRIPGTIGSFIDLASLVIEMKLQIKKNNGEDIPDDLNIGVVNGISNSLFKSISIFINDKMIESNPLFNYTSYLKMLMSINSDNINSFGKCGFFHDDANNGEVTKSYTNAIFTTAGNLENKLLQTLKGEGVDVCFPLLFDISTLDMYLLDGVDLRIRLEIASNSWIFNSNNANPQLSLNIGKVKLWMDRVIPHYNAMTALNQALSVKPIEYVFQKTLHKTYIVGANENSIMIDRPFGMVIPEKMHMLIINMNAFSGRSTLNGLYFEHANLENYHVTVNGNTFYNVNTDFSNSFYSQSYYETLKTIGINNNHMIDYNTFKAGRSVFSFNFVHETVEETLPVESSANLRLTLKFSANLTSPHTIILLAETTGLISIDANRMVTCDVRG